MTTWTKRELKSLKDNPNDYGWDDIRVPMQNTRINPTKSEPAFESWIDGIFAYHFDAANNNDESLHFSVQIPHSWAEGTELHPHLHWAPTTTGSGNVVWELEYVVAKVGDTFPSSATTLTVTSACDGVANKHQISELGVIDASTLQISSMFLCRLTRLGGDASDTYGADAVVCEFDIHFRQDATGSYHEYEKLSPQYIKDKGTPKNKFRSGAW